jgi:hypothetical protein
VALAFAFSWGALTSAIGRRSAPVAIALAIVVSASLAAIARRSAAVWGPRGAFHAELVLWRRHVGDRWWSSLTPEMQRLFREEVARRGHERHLMEGGDEPWESLRVQYTPGLRRLKVRPDASSTARSCSSANRLLRP